MKKIFLSLFFAALLSFAPAINAQRAAATPVASDQTSLPVQNGELNSKLMARKMPYNIILPSEYTSKKNARFPVLYLLHGLSGHYDNWAAKTKIAQYATKRQIILVMPEGGDGWYSDSISIPNDKYESYFVQELIPEIDKNFRTIAERRSRAVAGLSMGGFGALKFGAKYPEMFALAASMSGAVAAASYRTMDELPNNDWLRKPILATFGAPDSATHQENNLFKIFSQMPPEKIASLPFFYFDCGTEDALGLLPFNQQLAQILVKQKIPHEFRELPGKHNWDFWNQQLEEVLRLSDRIFAAK